MAHTAMHIALPSMLYLLHILQIGPKMDNFVPAYINLHALCTKKQQMDRTFQLGNFISPSMHF